MSRQAYAAQQRQLAREKNRLKKDRERFTSWYCDRCQVEVYSLRCKHCGKSRKEKS